jgi:probable F420-dependent oxidoreductase
VHPFRFGVQLSRAASGAGWRELARKVEALGYSTLYMPDHFEEQYGPIVALTVAAEATERLRVGSLVFDNDYRHPLVLAKELATLDLFSEGRLEVGLGAGWMRSDYDESGIPFEPAGVRVSRLEEAVAVMKALWTGETASYSGRHYRLDGAHGWPRPHSVPHPQLVIGGGSPRVLRLAAREADVVGINPNLAAGAIGSEVVAQLPVRYWEERVGWVRAEAARRGRHPELQCLTFFVTVGEPASAVHEKLAPIFSLPPEEVAEVPLALAGSVEEIVETLERRREALGISYWVVHEAEMEAFAPVVARLAGAGGAG